jgi:lysophospholipase L1-like esterase
MSRVAMIPVAPALLVQAKRLRRTALILPPAGGEWTGTIDGPRPLRLLVLGDSTAAGVGTDSQHEALPGNLGRELAERLGRGVDWRAIGESGATSRDIIERFLDEATRDDYDIVFLSIGANDALGLRSRGAFARDIRSIIVRLRDRSPDATILMSSLPAFGRFELLPDPLRAALYRHSRSLEQAARDVVSPRPGVSMSPPPPPYTEGFFATDQFHPSATGYRDWARFALDEAFAEGHLA